MKDVGFATAEERHYPHLLCSRLARILAESCGVKRKAVLISADAVAASRHPRRGEADLVHCHLSTTGLV